MNQFNKTVKIFTASSVRSSGMVTGLPIKTNVIKNNGNNPFSVFGENSGGIMQTPDNTIATFLDIIESAEQFRYLDFTKNILLLLRTDIVNLIDDTRPICVIEGLDEKTNEKINKLLDRHKVRSKVKSSIDDIIYYGSVSYLSRLEKENNKKVLKLYDLEKPHSTIIRDSKSRSEYLIPGANGVSIDESNIIYMGSGDFKLASKSDEFLPLIGNKTKLSAKASESIYSASEPLFYSIIPKVKLYYIKDLLATILSLRDAIQPTLLTLNQEITRSGADTASMNNNANNLEALINRLSDSAIAVSEIMDINSLVNAIFSSIRVVPDPGGTLQNLNNLNLEEFKEKLNRLKDGIDDLKKEILESLGIPSDLWEGSSNSNEVYQKNERLQSIVSTKLNVVKNATRKLVHAIIDQLHPELKITEDKIELKMFRKSQVEYARDQKEINLLKDGLSILSETLVSANDVIESNRFINKEAYYKYLYEALNNISPDYGKLIKPLSELKLSTEDEDDPDKY